MIYYGTGSELNNSLWSPSFDLPMIDFVLRGLELESYFGENHLGELFLDYLLPVSLCPSCGVDLTNFYLSNASVHWELWNRCILGLKPSSYLTAQIMVWAEKFIQ